MAQNPHKQMVNFNFGLGSDDSATPADPAGMQNTSNTDDAAVTADPVPSVAKAKPLTELMTDEGSSTEKIDVPAPVEVKKEVVVAKEPEIDILAEETPKNEIKEIPTPEVKEAKLAEKPAVTAPANPFAVPTVTPKEDSKPEEKKEEPKKENTPAPVVPAASPFSLPTVTPKEDFKPEEKKEEPKKENTPAPVVPAASPFSLPTVTPKEDFKPEEKKEEVKKEDTPAPVVPATSPFSVPPVTPKEDSKPEEKKEEPKKEEKKEIEIKPKKPSTPEVTPSSSNSTNATNDPMQSVGQVKNDIVAFVESHKGNVKRLQTEIAGLETKIQEEKNLLKSKGDAYVTMLKELQDLTQNFGLNGNEHTKQPHRPQHSNNPQSNHKK